MSEKKEKSENVLKATSGYVDKPMSTERYVKNIQSSDEGTRKYLYKIRQAEKERYYKQEAQIKAGVKPSKTKARVMKAVKEIKGFLPKQLKNRKVPKEQNRVTIALNQPVYSRDKSRFFKEQWEEEKKQLFFS